MESPDQNTIETSLIPFLEHHIEGYLFSDLENMRKIELGRNERAGSCGYPMVMSLLSACELMGTLLSNSQFNSYEGKIYFSNFWQNFLGDINPLYRNPLLSSLIYQLTRHGLAHLFITKPGIYVSKSHDSNHMQYDSNDQLCFVDAITLFDDFKKAYQKIIKPLALGTIQRDGFFKETMQTRLNELMEYCHQDSKKQFSLLPIKIEPRLGMSVAHASTSFESKPLSASFTYTPPQIKKSPPTHFL